jgi:hypothetical protein
LKLIAPVRGRTYTEKKGAREKFATLVALAMLSAFAAPASAAGAYLFTKVVDSVPDDFNSQTLRISCPSINTRGQEWPFDEAIFAQVVTIASSVAVVIISSLILSPVGL